jgi:hypothetical protein
MSSIALIAVDANVMIKNFEHRSVLHIFDNNLIRRYLEFAPISVIEAYLGYIAMLSIDIIIDV